MGCHGWIRGSPTNLRCGDGASWWLRVLPCSETTREKFMWALAHVGARAADVDMCGDLQPALVPMVDLLNHRPEGEATGALCYEQRDEGDVFVVRCRRAMAAGEALTLCYGAKDNVELLLGYGCRDAVRTCDRSRRVCRPVTTLHLSAQVRAAAESARPIAAASAAAR